MRKQFINHEETKADSVPEIKNNLKRSLTTQTLQIAIHRNIYYNPLILFAIYAYCNICQHCPPVIK